MADGDQRFAIREEKKIENSSPVPLKSYYFPPGRKVPDRNHSVARTDRESPSIR